MKGDPWAVAKEVLPERQVRALSKAALFTVLPREQVGLGLKNVKQAMGSSPAKDGGFAPNAASSAGRGAASLTKDRRSPESPYGEVGQNDVMALTTLARTEEQACLQKTT
jgi:hypothetical protein